MEIQYISIIKPVLGRYLPIFNIRMSELDSGEDNRTKHLKCHI